MSYRQEGSFDEMFRDEPMLAAGRRTAERVGSDLRARVAHHTPIAHPPPGVDIAEWQASRGGRAPGTLARSWEEEPVVARGGHFEKSVLTHDRIAALVEWETRPHTIRPRPDRAPATIVETGRPRGTVEDGRAALRFEGHGGVTYAREVHHPGTRGAHMMATALTEVAAFGFPAIGREEMERWAREQLR
jgi:hypothetical protein